MSPITTGYITGLRYAEDVVAAEDETAQAPLGPSAPSSHSLRAAPAPGLRLGKYVVEGAIGSGGMGVVVSARHEALGERVAIKLLHPKEARDAISRERFVREARSLARIKSEHVVRVLDAGVDEATGSPFIVMEHLEGLDLGQLLAQHGPLPVEMAADTIIQICEAVAAAHAVGIVHRDLKPSNFFLTKRPDGTALVKVLDFGISKAATGEGAPDPRLTETQAVFGSPTYMSPEQIRSAKNVDARSDVWSLGVALFELLTAKLPFEADNVAGLLASVVADPPLSLVRFAPHVPRDLEAIVYGCLEKSPSKRVSSATELAARLAPFATTDGAHLASRLERASRPGSGSFPPPARSTRPSYVPSVAPFGRTTGDLSATGPARGGPKGSVWIAVGVVGIVASVVIVVAALLFRRNPVAAAVPTASSAAAMPEPVPSVAPTPSALPTEATAPAPAPLPVMTAHPTRGKARPAASVAAAAASPPAAAASKEAPAPAPASSAKSSEAPDNRY